MKPKQHRIALGPAVDPRYDPKVVSLKARHLENLVLNFLAEVETLGADRHLEIEHGLNLREEVRRFEIDLIKYALQRTRGHQGRAAAPLGVNASTLNAKIKLYQLQTNLFRRAVEHESATGNISTCPASMPASDASPRIKGPLP